MHPRADTVAEYGERLAASRMLG